MPVMSAAAAAAHCRIEMWAAFTILILAATSLLKYAPQWSLKALPVDLRIKPWPIAILTLKNRTLSPVTQLFIEHLRGVAKSLSVQRSEQST